jgi:hypothetical protein
MGRIYQQTWEVFMKLSLLTISLWLLLPLVTLAQQPPDKEALPAPKIIELPPQGNLFITHQYVPGPQVGRRDVWELMTVNSRGMFVPRVVQAPGVSYYLYNGRPYPWTTTDSLPYMPYTTD